MPYYLVERQSGGCDYTIGCGIRITQLNAPNMEAAMYAASDKIGSTWRADHEGGIEKAERKSRKRIKDEADQREKDEDELHRLKRKLGR